MRVRVSLGHLTLRHQLEDTEDAHDTQHSEHGHLLAAAGEFLHVEGQDRHQVDPVHHALHEDAFIRRRQEAEDELDREYEDCDDLGVRPGALRQQVYRRAVPEARPRRLPRVFPGQKERFI